MDVAVWNFPPAELLTSGMASGDRSKQFKLYHLHIPDCARALLGGQADLALLPTLTVLQHYKDLDVVPAVALSSWRYPFARIVMEHDLSEPVRSMSFDPDFEQERKLAEIVLREHYRMEPEFVALNGMDEPTNAADARLLVSAELPTQRFEGIVLDLGQEWYELANYPMTWGLFAARKGELAVEDIREVRDAVLESERHRTVWLQAQETSADLHDFYSESVRFRLDDLCLAGLTEFRQFLFYYDVVDEMREIPFVFIQEDEDEGDGLRKPLL